MLVQMLADGAGGFREMGLVRLSRVVLARRAFLVGPSSRYCVLVTRSIRKLAAGAKERRDGVCDSLRVTSQVCDLPSLPSRPSSITHPEAASATDMKLH